MEANQKLLRELELPSFADLLPPAKKTTRKRKAEPRAVDASGGSEAEPEEVRGRRTSLRLLGVT